jgi:hypothetical protein
MNDKVTDPRPRYKLVTILMLLAGLGSAVAIYLTAGNPDEIGMVEEFEESKRFAHDLELYGGKANLIANKFSRWFEGLWHGQSLAYTVAVLTVVIAVGYFLVASRLAAHAASDAAHDNNRGETENKTK